MITSPLPRDTETVLFVMRKHVHYTKFDYLYSKYQLKFFSVKNKTLTNALNSALLAYKETTIPDLKTEYSVMIWVLMHEMAFRGMPL